jgi:hypothetical protein
MKRIFNITDTLGRKKRGLDIDQAPNPAASPAPEGLIAQARHFAEQAPGSAAADLILQLCAALEQQPAGLPDVRREIFREAVKGIANVIRKGQLPADLPLAGMLPGAYGTPELLAQEIERANAGEPVTLAELRQVRQKLKTASEGNEEIDEAIKRIYYAKLFESNQSTENIMPPGSPSRSIDLAALVVERVLPNGWWTMGNNGDNLEDQAIAKVGTWAGDDPKPESGPTAPLTLLSALVLTLIEAAKKDS